MFCLRLGHPFTSKPGICNTCRKPLDLILTYQQKIGPAPQCLKSRKKSSLQVSSDFRRLAWAHSEQTVSEQTSKLRERGLKIECLAKTVGQVLPWLTPGHWRSDVVLDLHCCTGEQNLSTVSLKFPSTIFCFTVQIPPVYPYASVSDQQSLLVL